MSAEAVPVVIGRLDRLESKIDTLSGAIVDLARVEERLASVVERLARLHEALAEAKAEAAALARRVEALELGTGRDRVTIRGAERLAWMLAAAGVSGLAAWWPK